MRRILFLAQAEILHVVRDRATAGAGADRADRADARAVERRHVRDPQHADLDRRSRSDDACRAAWSIGSRPRATSTSSARRRRSTAADERCWPATRRWSLVIPHDFEASLRADRRCASGARRSTPRKGRPRASSSRTRRAMLAELCGGAVAGRTTRTTAPRIDVRVAQPLQPDAATTSTTWCPASWWRW